MKNVLLLCLSKMNINASKGKYSYELADGSQGEELTGFLTNEAPAKSVINRLHHDNRQRLDRIVVICSDATNNPMIDEKNQNDAKPDLVTRILELTESLTEMTHLQYYKDAVNDYAKNVDSQYAVEPIEFCEILVSDDTNAKEISEAAVSAANRITDMGDMVNLYIDYNGGQRYMAFMMYSIANLMKLRQVEIRQILTMNWSESNSSTSIDNNKSVFDSVDLISGINEYINYGRIRSLREYFAPSKNDTILSLLDDMEKFANNLQLCRTTYIMTVKGELLQKLQNQAKVLKNKKRNADNGEKDIYEVLFAYVLQDIREGYKDLLQGELPEMIKWCVERDYIQQALTFCSEQLPRYFWDKGIFRPTKEEQNEYNIFLKRLFEKTDRQSRTLQGNYKSSLNQKKNIDESKSGYAYNWMVKYLGLSCKRRDKKNPNMPTEYEEVMLQEPACELFLQGPSGKKWQKKTWDKLHLDAIEQEVKEMGITPNRLYEEHHELLQELNYPVVSRIRQFEQGKRVDNEGTISYQKLGTVLIVYFLLKGQRNNTNHADDSDDETLWTYQELHDVIGNYADFLSGLD